MAENLTFTIPAPDLEFFFFNYKDAVKKGYEKLPYDEWRGFKSWLKSNVDSEDIVVTVFPSKYIVFFRGNNKHILRFRTTNDFCHYLWDYLVDNYMCTTNTVSGGYFNGNYTTTTTAVPTYTTSTYTINASDYYNSGIEIGNVKIKNNEITIDGKKVLTEGKDNSMDMKEFGFDFGPVTNSNIAISPFGIAVKRANSSDFCYYDPHKCEVVDCTPLTFSDKKFLYKMPVAVSAIAEGDVIMHNGTPMFVKGLEDDQGRVVVIDIAASEEKYILPVKNVFGFNFVTKIVSLINMQNCGASAENPFGNMLPLLMLMKDGKDLDPMMLLMMGGFNGSTNMNAFGPMMQNPLMMYMLMQKDSNLSKMLPFLLMQNASQKN